MTILIICLIIIIIVVDVIISSIKKKKRHKRLISHLQEIQNQTKNNNQMIQNNNDNNEHQDTYQNKAHNDCLDCDLNEKYYNDKKQIVNGIKNKTKYCMYCGASTTENITKCPNCHADLNG